MNSVLIVDDEKSLLLSLTAGLDAYKDRFNVLTAENGSEAVEILEIEKIDLLITDLKMPEMNGFELLAYMSSFHPAVPCVVMTAFNTPEIEKKLEKTASLRIIEKPIDFDVIIDTITEFVKDNKEGTPLPGISLSNFLQLLSMEGKTCLLEVSDEKFSGFFYFFNGKLFDAAFNKMKGEKAVFKMLQLNDIKISYNDSPPKKLKRNIKKGIMALLLDAAKQKDEQEIQEKKKIIVESALDMDSEDLQFVEYLDDGKKDSEKHKIEKTKTNKKGEDKMGKIEALLEKFKIVGGILAVGVFSPEGEMVAEMNASGIKLAEIGALANDVLLKAQKATEIMEVGRGQMVHIEAPKAHIVARCLNEAASYSNTTEGKAHVHVVVIIRGDGNLAMAKMKLSSIIGELAQFFR